MEEQVILRERSSGALHPACGSGIWGRSVGSLNCLVLVTELATGTTLPSMD